MNAKSKTGIEIVEVALAIGRNVIVNSLVAACLFIFPARFALA